MGSGAQGAIQPIKLHDRPVNPVEVARHFVLGNHVARVHAVDRLIEVRSDRPHLTRERDDLGPRFAGQGWAEIRRGSRQPAERFARREPL